MAMDLTETVLENDHVRLEPLREIHREQLRDACNADQDVWPQFYLYSLANEHFDPFWARVQKDRESGSWIPFAVMSDSRCVGISCYIGIEPVHRALEVGNTYYRPEFRGTAVNPAAKHLLLRHAFSCSANRVQFRVDARNVHSRTALVKLGATQEGVFRQERVMWTGRVRDTMFFSILREEWPIVEAKLLERLANSRAAGGKPG